MKWSDELGLAYQTGGGPESVQLTLSIKGWNQIQPLPRPGGIPGQCFVAMWFSEITKAAYDQGIEPAVIVTHTLPQAIPGSRYAAQLAIPLGLGYPFAKCELLGDTPTWLTLDCATLQLQRQSPGGGSAGRWKCFIEDHSSSRPCGSN